MLSNSFIDIIIIKIEILMMIWKLYPLCDLLIFVFYDENAMTHLAFIAIMMRKLKRLSKNSIFSYLVWLLTAHKLSQ